MGVDLKTLVVKHHISAEELAHKTIIVDAFNTLYQFLSTIRTPDGALFTNHEGKVTSHLIGLFSRVANLTLKGLKLAFVFDGQAPTLKQQEIEKRAEAKAEAEKLYERAVARKDILGMRKYAARTTRLTPELVDQAKKLLDLLGIPWLQAPFEGEAQAAAIVKAGMGWAVGSQDYDSLLYGASRLVQNLAAERRLVQPELVNLEENLAKLGISQDQLIVLAIMIGTDYNPGGVRGIGPKKGLALVKRFGNDFKSLFKNVGWDYKVDWREIFKLFKEMPVLEKCVLEWKPVNVEGATEFLVQEHDFNPDRVQKTLKALASQAQASQKGLCEFL